MAPKRRNCWRPRASINHRLKHGGGGTGWSRARGGLVVDLTWKDGRVSEYQIRSSEPRDVVVRVNGETKNARAIHHPRRETEAPE